MNPLRLTLILAVLCIFAPEGNARAARTGAGLPGGSTPVTDCSPAFSAVSTVSPSLSVELSAISAAPVPAEARSSNLRLSVSGTS